MVCKTFDIHFLREFMQKVGWVTSPVAAVLLYGSSSDKEVMASSNLLRKMTRTKDPSLRAYELGGFHHKAYRHPTCKRHHIDDQHGVHDEKLRMVLASLVHHYPHLLDKIDLGAISDATAQNKNGDTVHIELDRDTETIPYISKKIDRHYSGKERMQVVFVMATGYPTKENNRERLLKTEHRNVEKMNAMLAKKFPNLPNRILVSGYHDFLNTCEVYNFKGIPQSIWR